MPDLIEAILQLARVRVHVTCTLGLPATVVRVPGTHMCMYVSHSHVLVRLY